MNYKQFQAETQPTGSVLSGKILFKLAPGGETVDAENLIKWLRELGAVFENDTVYISRHIKGRTTCQNINVIKTEENGSLTIQ